MTCRSRGFFSTPSWVFTVRVASSSRLASLLISVASQPFCPAFPFIFVIFSSPHPSLFLVGLAALSSSIHHSTSRSVFLATSLFGLAAYLCCEACVTAVTRAIGGSRDHIPATARSLTSFRFARDCSFLFLQMALPSARPEDMTKSRDDGNEYRYPN